MKRLVVLSVGILAGMALMAVWLWNGARWMQALGAWKHRYWR